MQEEQIDEVLEENQEIIEDIEKFDPNSITVYSRDWTIETIYSQIEHGNINLNPEYQRRNAWNDEKRSKLIESTLMSYPIPEIVLAEDQEQKKSFGVIDGKQRLLTIAGFINPEKFKYWEKPVLGNLGVKKELEGLSYARLESEERFTSEHRQFLNSSIRCTIITGFKTNDVLYDIFYRLNSGSVSLATQELRQVLNRGKFANFLIDATNKKQPIHDVMNLSGPDNRLRDIEIILRCISMILYAHEYRGNLKTFLDNTMRSITRDWSTLGSSIQDVYDRINKTIEVLCEIFSGCTNVGRKFRNGNIERKFNRVLLEVQVFYFYHIDPIYLTKENKEKFLSAFQDLVSNDIAFRTSVESSTKSIENYVIRFGKFQQLVNNSFNCNVNINPFEPNVSR